MTPFILKIQSAIRRLSVQEALIFGSYARENATDESDLDLIAVVPSNHDQLDFHERVQWIRNIRHALAAEGIRISLDVLVYSPHQWQQFLRSDSGFAQEIRQSALQIA